MRSAAAERIPTLQRRNRQPLPALARSGPQEAQVSALASHSAYLLHGVGPAVVAAPRKAQGVAQALHLAVGRQAGRSYIFNVLGQPAS